MMTASTLGPTLGQALDELIATVRARANAPADESYTASLLAGGPMKCAKKLGEEAVETALAAVSGKTTALAEETADLLYHLVVTLEACKTDPAEIAAILTRRQAQSGLAEKASRH
ncbi:MAG: phosphoribosyl-ATP diphosphatase [Hyphomonadaceae bacterium]